MNKLLLGSAMLLSALSAFANDDLAHNDNRFDVRYIKNNKRMPDAGLQQKYANTPAWQQFVQQNGPWMVMFNEESGKPHMAYGPGIATAGATPQERAYNFITGKLGMFNIPVQDLMFQSAPRSRNHQFVNYFQTYQGVRVLNTRLEVKMTPEGNVILWSADVYSDINISTMPSISESAAANFAKSGITDPVTGTTVTAGNFILPVPDKGKNTYYLVYEVNVLTKDEYGIPGNYKTLVDAVTGKVLSRQNQVKFVGPPVANTDVTVTASVFPTHLYNPAQVMPLANLKMVANSSTFYTDQAGYIGLPNTTSTSATFSLEGSWSQVLTNNVTPTFTTTLNPGTNNISFTQATMQELCGYYHVNIVHDNMKGYFPSFPSMDNALPTNIDVAGSCNAFYNGPSINFYAMDGTCNALSQCADVVYHEYGHGISDKFYQWNFASFDNGAMGEGYSDVWGCSITQSALLGVGFYVANQTPIRRYDINGKVYPQDIQGEVHADGEIICGAWWDLGVSMGIPFMKNLFTDTYWDLVTGPDGTEGQVYYDILIAALTDDDVISNGGDNNICNGTPNGTAIANAFAAHGITLLTGTNIAHNALFSVPGGLPIAINATITNIPNGCGFSGAFAKWRPDDTSPWNQIPLNLVSGNNYSGNIPSQPNGTIIRYYVGLLDNNNVVCNVQPSGAAATTNANIPYYMLVGFDSSAVEDMDLNGTGNFVSPVPGDNATTGLWVVTQPVPSFLDPNNPASMVQTGSQNTPGGLFCAITGNAPNPTDGAGTNDVDGGKTTLETPPFNASTLVNPSISYYRWYSNNQGATPMTDYWQVYISNDNTNWVQVENTLVSDHSWRNFAFKISDYVTPNNNIVLRFVAEDGTTPSLVEAAVDDIVLWGQSFSSVEEQTSILNIIAYPNPAKDDLKLDFTLADAQHVSMQIVNLLGETVSSADYGQVGAGSHRYDISTATLQAGIYMLNLQTDKGQKTIKLTIIK